MLNDLSLASPWLPRLWGVLVGFVFSPWARWGILASSGLISMRGLSVANQVKPMARMLALATPRVAEAFEGLVAGGREPRAIRGAHGMTLASHPFRVRW